MGLYMGKNVAAVDDIFVDVGQLLFDAVNVLGGESMFLDHLAPE